MPVEVSAIQLPCGARCGRIVWSGAATMEDATAVWQHTNPGQHLHARPILVLAQRMESLAPEVRAFLGGQKEWPETAWVAIVVSSPVIRVVSNFIIRINKSPRQRLFSSEEAATQWLDERAAEDAANGKAGGP